VLSERAASRKPVPDRKPKVLPASPGRKKKKIQGSIWKKRSSIEKRTREGIRADPRSAAAVQKDS